MYYVKKTIEISAAHSLALNYESACSKLHGHNWIITIYLRSEELDENGMVLDFSIIKKEIHGLFDHENINLKMPGINPTAENIAKFIKDKLGEKCYRVEVQETNNNIAIYEE